MPQPRWERATAMTVQLPGEVTETLSRFGAELPEFPSSIPWSDDHLDAYSHYRATVQAPPFSDLTAGGVAIWLSKNSSVGISRVDKVGLSALALHFRYTLGAVDERCVAVVGPDDPIWRAEAVMHVSSVSGLPVAFIDEACAQVLIKRGAIVREDTSNTDYLFDVANLARASGPQYARLRNEVAVARRDLTE